MTAAGLQDEEEELHNAQGPQEARSVCGSPQRRKGHNQCCFVPPALESSGEGDSVPQLIQ
jgi:hypothetical protein